MSPQSAEPLSITTTESAEPTSVTSEPATIETPVTPIVTVTPPSESIATFASQPDTNGHKASTIDEAIAEFKDAVSKPETDDEVQEPVPLSAVEADAVAPEVEVLQAPEESNQVAAKADQPGEGDSQNIDTAATGKSGTPAVEAAEPETTGGENDALDVETSNTGASTPSGAETPLTRNSTPPPDGSVAEGALSAEATPFRRHPSAKNKKKNKKKKNAQAQATAQDVAGEEVEGDGQAMDEIDLN